jgi:DNA-binding phage protein
MPLSKSFNQTTKPLIRENPAFRRELLVNAANALLAGDLDTAKAILRMYVNGAVGFIPLAAALGHSSKTLMRILSPRGNPQARTLLHLLAHLQRAEGISLIATEAPPAKRQST